MAGRRIAPSVARPLATTPWFELLPAGSMGIGVSGARSGRVYVRWFDAQRRGRTRDGSLAQLVERHVYTVDVIGSIPVGPTELPKPASPDIPDWWVSSYFPAKRVRCLTAVVSLPDGGCLGANPQECPVKGCYGQIRTVRTSNLIPPLVAASEVRCTDPARGCDRIRRSSGHDEIRTRWQPQSCRSPALALVHGTRDHQHCLGRPAGSSHQKWRPPMVH